MSEKPPKRGVVADAEALGGSDAAQARVRRWWRLLPRTLTRPTDVFVALRDDDETDVEARSEPILAIVMLAGMAGIVLTPAWGTLLDEQSLDWLVLAVLTFIGGLLYGVAGYFLLGLAVWAGLRGVGRRASAREARQVLAFSCVPLALSLFVTVPAAIVAFGSDYFRSGGADGGVGHVLVVAVGLVFVVWSLGLLALGLRVTYQLAWQGVVGTLGLAAVLVAVLAVLPDAL